MQLYRRGDAGRLRTEKKTGRQGDRNYAALATRLVGIIMDGKGKCKGEFPQILRREKDEKNSGRILRKWIDKQGGSVLIYCKCSEVRTEAPRWRDVRVVEGTGLENRRRASVRGFESHSLRQPKDTRNLTDAEVPKRPKALPC